MLSVNQGKNPFRKELFSGEQLRKLGKQRAEWHDLRKHKIHLELLDRLEKNREKLRHVYNALNDVLNQKDTLVPAGEWLLDNYYIIIDQFTTIKIDLSYSYLKELPQLDNGRFPGIPRVYDIIIDLISHTDSKISEDILKKIMKGYQDQVPLMIAELWAIPVLLRVALIENIRRIAVKVAFTMEEHARADKWITKLKEAVTTGPLQSIVVLADLMKETKGVLSDPFIAQLGKQLRSLDLSAFISLINQSLVVQGNDIDQITIMENHEQALDRISIANCMQSLRFIDRAVWKEIIEDICVVHNILEEDDGDVYAKMDFETRDMYRRAVEGISRNYHVSEPVIAAKTVSLAIKARQEGADDEVKRTHSGYYLFNEGLDELLGSLQKRRTLGDWGKKFRRRHAFATFFGSTCLLTALVTAGIFMLASPFAHPIVQVALFLVGVSVVVPHFTTSLVMNACNITSMSMLLPKMDFSDGIPDDARTMIAMEVLLTNEEQLHAQVGHIERIYLSNIDKSLLFALVTDLPDSAVEITDRDLALIAFAKESIQALNERYLAEEGGKFYLFHRKRTWHDREKKWMGWERKRGAIMSLNTALRDQAALSTFSDVIGDTDELQTIKYVITIDTDTFLPFNGTKKLVGIMEHPLNQFVYDEDKRRVVDGYGIIQPLMLENFQSANETRYGVVASGDFGLDPYSHAASNFYQDMFGEGSFLGKGIYHVDIFMKVLENAIPENTVLSHDLIEGCYVRSGLASDVKAYEDSPGNYLTDVFRHHRWTRGDWQISRWACRSIKDKQGKSRKNTLSSLSKWKILDNMRRSLVPVGFLFFFFAGWFLSTNPLFWTLLSVLLWFSPSIISSIMMLVEKRPSKDLEHFSSPARQRMVKSWQKLLLELVLLPFTAWVNMDAILRGMVRLHFTKRKILEWQTFQESQNRARSNNLSSFLKTMWVSPVVAVFTLACIITWFPWLMPIAGVFLVIWTSAPVVAWWLSKPLRGKSQRLPKQDEQFLGKVARRTWRYFETFVGPDSNWLPPDNYQEIKTPVVAMRTSPTNMGLALLSDLAACDFGYINVDTCLARLERGITTMDRLDRYHGHFFNWYDIKALIPLKPLYVSTVDSGNLIGYLLTLRQGLLALLHQPVDTSRLFRGMRDCVNVILEICNETRESSRTTNPGLGAAIKILTHLHETLEGFPLPAGEARDFIEMVRELVGELDGVVIDPTVDEIDEWTRLLKRQLDGAIEEFRTDRGWELSLDAVATDLDALAQRGDASIHPSDLVKRCVQLCRELDAGPSYAGMLDNYERTRETFQDLFDIIRADNTHVDPEPDANQILDLLRGLKIFHDHAAQVHETVHELLLSCLDLCDIDYQFLINKDSNLFSIGFNLDNHHLDPASYDLFASEARLMSFIAIALGQLPLEHWFSLNRTLTKINKNLAMISWGGTMFEYLMPLLIMPNYEGTILDVTCKTVVDVQREYGKHHETPWGISESGYNLTDALGNYQYMAFGVPKLGLKRGLEKDLVIAPYASILALMVAPGDAIKNMKQLRAKGFMGRYGFYEAIDFTKVRVPPRREYVVVQSFMTHHQSMSFLSLANVLLKRGPQEYFKAEPRFNAHLLLLQEKLPAYSRVIETSYIRPRQEPESFKEHPVMRMFDSPHTIIPEVTILSNGRYHVMINNSGGGNSRWKDRYITRWWEDVTRRGHGFCCYVKDLHTGKTGSLSYQPTLVGSNHRVVFSSSRVEIFNELGDLNMQTTIVVSPDEDVELRRVELSNKSDMQRDIQLCTYIELTLDKLDAFLSHPVFNSMFVKTSINKSINAIFATRRTRDEDISAPVIFHSLHVHEKTVNSVSFETDREKFIGRCGSVRRPRALVNGTLLTNSDGHVLDPILAISAIVRVEPGERVTLDIILGVSDNIEQATMVVKRYKNKYIADRSLDLSWASEQMFLRQRDISEAETQTFSQLASSIIYPSKLRRAEERIIKKNVKAQDGLWALNISGDNPIVLVFIESPENIRLIHAIVKAHGYWRSKGIMTDLIIVNQDFSGYRQALHEQIIDLVTTSGKEETLNRPGGFFVFKWDQLSDEHKILLQSTARVVLNDKRGTLEEQVDAYRLLETLTTTTTTLTRTLAEMKGNLPSKPVKTPDLLFFNGLGGFTQDGREYIIRLLPGMTTPRPWINVLANPRFGTIVSESGSSYTWFENAQQFRLTPWYNDYVTDLSGELFYLRDDMSYDCWSPTPLPRRGQEPYTCRHGLGYSLFEHEEHGISSEMTISVALEAPVKITRIKVKNTSKTVRNLSIIGYVEWVLGDHREHTAMHVVTSRDIQTAALFAKNPFHREFGGCVAFFATNYKMHTITGDRSEFIGRNGDLFAPTACSLVQLSNKTGAALDPCSAFQVPAELQPGEEQEIIFVLGCGRDKHDARDLVSRFCGVAPAHGVLEDVWRFWPEHLGSISFETPDVAINVLCNNWLLYQALSSRVWGRTGFYQSGGAIGFRDQLQDAMAFLHTMPLLLRDQIKLCAGKQYVEGDVMHWWHPPTGSGVRTNFSDDLLWLPFVVSYYVLHKEDTGVLDETIHYIEGRLLDEGEDSYFDLPHLSDQSGTIYDHCKRAIKQSLKFGKHGLPLMGSGDWNDGMSHVGKDGGESMWLAFFMIETLNMFSSIASSRGDDAFTEECFNHVERLKANVDKFGWDGAWFSRAFFGDGTPLGSHVNDECKIDSISQSWATLSRTSSKQRREKALDSARKLLFDEERGLIKLFHPPFDKTGLDPGYVKHYPPGTRENGGHYSHAAIWLVMAFTKMGDNHVVSNMLSALNPVYHGNTREKIKVYKVEPYVMPADIYTGNSNAGLGGWTWYTGSAGWMYRLVVESILGIDLRGDKMRFSPCIPPAWKDFKIHYQYHDTMYHLEYTRGSTGEEAPMPVLLDGMPVHEGEIQLVDDLVDHHVLLTIGDHGALHRPEPREGNG